MDVSLGEVIAAIALLFSGYATWRSRGLRKKEEELIEVQRKLNELMLDKEKREAQSANSAELGANFITLGSKKHRLKVFNKGKATAYQVSLEFPEGNDCIMNSDLEEKFPMEAMEPGQSVELIASFVMQTKRKQAIRLHWMNAEGESFEKVVHATL
ncbi:hypothetical protein CWE08_12080 [Aliidiomarina iranensis]|uniref:Uncharacterized protein n=1 Tax=Aliidiomarina iranensis TaxID=1434071 RepID=A0A432VPE6_9GAMM|nr:hypothetical protein [Aliidiomarina iranensis]RUO18005.1 hypothetical protein CWE08_12080 [Aliidiomarina iranensis]